MTITQICKLLKEELLDNGYEYGFVLDDKRYKPNLANGFDSEYYNLASSIYCVQAPDVTRRYKIGTCIDAVVLMKALLDEQNVPNKIWLLYDVNKNRAHTVLTFLAEDKTVYLELTPQYSKEWYGREIICESESEMLERFYRDGFEPIDVTDSVKVSERPFFLLNKLK